MKIESFDTDIATLLGGGYYIIPRFQRPYSWDQENVSEFWADLIENKGEEYFIGAMVLYRKSKLEFGIVDGQQRLTTITILLCALRDTFAENGHKELADGLHQLVERRNMDFEAAYVLKTETAFPYFPDEIQRFGSPQLNSPPKPEEERLSKSHNQLKALVGESIKSIDADTGLTEKEKEANKLKKLKVLRDTLLNLKLIKVVLDSEEDAYIIFETLNTRGKDLALTDLIKNHFAKQIKKKGGIDVAKEKWTKFLTIFDSSSADISADIFLTHYWASRYEAVTQKKVFGKFKKKVTKDKALKFLNEILGTSIFDVLSA